MSGSWTWDESLFRGAAPHYSQGRVPYPSSLAQAFASVADLSGAPRLIDVGCGPGTVGVRLAPLVAEVVGIDADPEMVHEAQRSAEAAGVGNARWVHLRAEHLPAGLGPFRYATFAQSFHWMDREQVARLVFQLLEVGGAFVHVDTGNWGARPVELPGADPPPPAAEIDALTERYLGPGRRAGQGQLGASGSPGDEGSVLAAAGFQPPTVVPVPGGDVLTRTTDDVVASVFSLSRSAPHLFGERLGPFERDLRALLASASTTGRFAIRTGDLRLAFHWRSP